MPYRRGVSKGGGKGGDDPPTSKGGGDTAPQKFVLSTYTLYTYTHMFINPHGIVVTRIFDSKTGTIRRTIRTGT